MTLEDRLFIGVYPCTLVYSDRATQRDGDYSRVASLDYATLTFSVAPGAPAELVELARRDAASVQARRGEAFHTSACGQSVILGGAL